MATDSHEQHTQAISPPPEARSCHPEALFFFDPEKHADVKFANLHHRMLVPSEEVKRSGPVSPLPVAQDSGILHLQIPDGKGGKTSVEEALKQTFTDGILVLHHGNVIFEWYGDGCGEVSDHCWWSISKALTSCIVAILQEEGKLDIDKMVLHYLPELNPGAWEGVTVRDCLMMRSGISYEYNPFDPTCAMSVHLLGVRCGRTDPDLPRSAYEFLRDRLTGRAFPVGERLEYNEGNAETVGWVCERATGATFAELVRAKIWSKLGMEHDAYYDVCRGGLAGCGGGMNSCLRDLGRFGQMLLQEGRWGEEQVVPRAWLKDAMLNKESDPAWFSTMSHTKLPEALFNGFPLDGYNNFFWHHPGSNGKVFSGWGARGNLCMVNAHLGLVFAKFGSIPGADCIKENQAFMAVYHAICNKVSSAEDGAAAVP